MDFVFVICGIISLVLLMVTVFLVDKSDKKLKNCGVCKGIIVGFEKNTSELRVGDYETEAISPVVSYTVDNQKYEFTGKYYSTNMKRGQLVDVIYDKNNAAKASIKKGLFFGPVITGALSLFFAVASAVCVALNSAGVVG